MFLGHMTLKFISKSVVYAFTALSATAFVVAYIPHIVASLEAIASLVFGLLNFERFYQVLCQALVRLESGSGLLLLHKRFNILRHEFKHGCKHAIQLIQSIMLVCLMLSTVPLSLLGH